MQEKELVKHTPNEQDLSNLWTVQNMEDRQYNLIKEVLQKNYMEKCLNKISNSVNPKVDPMSNRVS